MKLLITGGTGAIGLEVLSQLHALNQLDNVSVLVRDSKKNRKKLKRFAPQLTIFWGDITDRSTLIPACLNQEVVFHLAAIIPPESEKFPERCKRINEEGTRNLVETLEEHAPQAHVIYSSSVVVYGDRLKQPNIAVSDALETAHNDHYGFSKIAAEKCITESQLNWTIFRLSAIMGIGNHKVSAIMFHVPLETPMEIATVRDTARAFVHSLAHREAISRKTFNLGGGEQCRIVYKDFLGRAFSAFGMGAVNFPEFAFARQNFHCGYYTDGDDLEDILAFRKDTIETYFNEFRKSVPVLQRIATRPFAGIIKWFLARISEPLRAYKTKNAQQINHFFGKLDT